ncbi:MAG: type II secretion system F family protein [Bdellovibrionales bacterium]|nr:type II secretion system F family protein [Bdellovibrionales bacterium]
MFKPIASENKRFKALLGLSEESSLLMLPAPAAEKGKVSFSNHTVNRLMLSAGIDSIAHRRKILSQLGLLVCIVLAISLGTGRLFLMLLAPLAVAVQYFMLRKQAHKRVHAFEKDYTALLLALSSAVKTGLDPLVALQQSGVLFTVGSEVRKEVEKFSEAIERGGSEAEVVRQFACSIDHPDLDLFRTAFILSRREGSSLAGCLQRLARVTRQRQSFRRKVKSALALQKLSALGIAACTVVIGIIQYASNPTAIQQTLAHPMGSKILVFGLVLVCGGVIWMFKLASDRVA